MLARRGLTTFYRYFTVAVSANMWGWDGSQLLPPLLSAWSKIQVGWVDIVDINAASAQINVLASCEGDTVYRITNDLQQGECFLIENRYPCGFDEGLTNTKNVTKSRNGMAIWHVDETDLFVDSDGKFFITYGSQGVCANGVCQQHYRVALVQGDANFDLEKGTKKGGGINKGDSTDLFRKRSDPFGGIIAYKIDNNGVSFNSGLTSPEPNTKGYSGPTGAEYATGITIEVGASDKLMTLTVTFLEGATGTDTISFTNDGTYKVSSIPVAPTVEVPIQGPAPRPNLSKHLFCPYLSKRLLPFHH